MSGNAAGDFCMRSHEKTTFCGDSKTQGSFGTLSLTGIPPYAFRL